MVALHASMTMASMTKIPQNHVQYSPIHMGGSSLRVRSAISIPKLPNNGKLLKELNKRITKTIPLEEIPKKQVIDRDQASENTTTTKTKLYVVLEAVLDRIEMHQNMGEQRENWNSLLLNSLNMISLTAATLAGLATSTTGGTGAFLPLKISSLLLFSAATGILMIMNKIQPSQLVEEQRNAVRLFKQLRNQVETKLSLEEIPTEKYVEVAMEKVLAIDRAYPLPLLGVMLDKFPETYKPAVWWPGSKQSIPSFSSTEGVKKGNGWGKELEEEMREIMGVIEKKDLEDYYKLGNKALKLNKTLAMTGPVLMGIAAVGSAFVGHGGPWAGLLAAVAGSLGTIVNTIEHGGQVGMVFEMYRNCGGFFNLLEETVESTLQEGDLEKRENGEIFEMKMALHLGRSLSELRDLASKSRTNGGFVDEFASKLF